MTTGNSAGSGRGDAETLPGGAPDQEVADLMARLSDLQGWCALMGRKDSGGIAASQLVMDTRCLIVERLYPRNIALRSRQPQQAKD